MKKLGKALGAAETLLVDLASKHTSIQTDFQDLMSGKDMKKTAELVEKLKAGTAKAKTYTEDGNAIKTELNEFIASLVAINADAVKMSENIQGELNEVEDHYEVVESEA